MRNTGNRCTSNLKLGAVNIENGLKTIDIYSSREVTNYEE